MNISKELLDKYNQAVPRYTSYPPANFFNQEFSQKQYKQFLVSSNSDEPHNISLYIHIPFCKKLCFYCGCNTHITRDKDLMSAYVKSLMREIEMYADLLNPYRKVSQIHWGGGTPNVIEIGLIESVMELIHKKFSFIDKPEIAIETNPAYLTEEYIKHLKPFGFNRFSLGIQDFQEKVLNAVNRDVSVIPVNELVKIIKDEHTSVNLDFIYGLPFQSEESFKATIAKAIEADPDRIVTFSYAHVPWVKKHQEKLESYELPNAEEKVRLFESAYNQLIDAGYKAIGMDHYAKADDEMSIALDNHQLHRNFQGYCTRRTTGQVYAFGASSISQLHKVYVQNVKDVKTYMEQVEKGNFPIEKGYEVNNEEIAMREVINELMCNKRLVWSEVAARVNMDSETLKNITAYSKDKFYRFAAEHLIQYLPDGFKLKETGNFFIRNIAAALDPKLENASQKFSKSI